MSLLTCKRCGRRLDVDEFRVCLDCDDRAASRMFWSLIALIGTGLVIAAIVRVSQ